MPFLGQDGNGKTGKKGSWQKMDNRNEIEKLKSKKFIAKSLALLIGMSTLFTAMSHVRAVSDNNINVWWPAEGSILSGVQPLKAELTNKNINNYNMFWFVDGGQWNWMEINNSDYPHKESSVDVNGWGWNNEGLYKIGFVATEASGNIIAKTERSVYINKNFSSTKKQENETSASPRPAEIIEQLHNPLAGQSFWVNPNSPHKKWIEEKKESDPRGAQLMKKIADKPGAVWFGNWNTNIKHDVDAYLTATSDAEAFALLVLYNIPGRDCGGYSGGGLSGGDTYKSWIDQVKAGIGGRKAVIILEPDALPGLDCLSPEAQKERLTMIRSAVQTLSSDAVFVYIDAGHSDWKPAKIMAERLAAAGIERAQGFALNSSNFQTNESNIAYGENISSQLGGTHFIFDTARNGNGHLEGQWCNPPGRGLGSAPTTQTGHPLVDAFIWTKVPGESDGPCNGGPAAGTFWPEYALGLAERSR